VCRLWGIGFAAGLRTCRLPTGSGFPIVSAGVGQWPICCGVCGNRVLATARERRRQKQHGWQWMVQRVAASVVIAAIAGGAVAYHQIEERRKGEAAREQVMLALKITNKTLNRVNERLTDDNQ
jgi:hypothetical protein